MPSSRRRRQSQFPVAGVVGGIVLLVLIALGVWYWLQRDPAPDPVPVETPTASVDTQPEFDEPEVPPLDLPDLSASDEFVRGLVGRLSSHPQLARWLVTDDLVQRFVGVVVDLAGASNPAEHVQFMRPEQDFQVRTVNGRTVIHSDSYRRYDLLAATFTSLDAEGTVRLYRQLRPLIEEAYADLGIPDHTFDETLAMAIRNLQGVEVPSEPPQVESVDGVYEFSDPQLENRRGAEKAMLRMGPENTRRIQGKLSELARGLGIEPR